MVTFRLDKFAYFWKKISDVGLRTKLKFLLVRKQVDCTSVEARFNSKNILLQTRPKLVFIDRKDHCRSLSI